MKRGIVLLMALFLATMPIKAYAAENTTETFEVGASVEAGQTGTGDKMSPCTVTFCITDESGGYTGTKIKAVMTDVTGTMTDEYTFTPANSWKEKVCPKYSVVAPATYNVTFEGLEDGYSMVNTLDFSSDIKIVATPEGNVDVYWSIISMATDALGEDNAVESQLLGEERHNVENEEAEQVFQAFLERVAFIEEDDTWDNFFQRFKWFDNSGWYEKYVGGANAEDYANLSLFDHFVWEDTYLSFCHYVNSGNRDLFLGNQENFRNNFLDSRLNDMTGNNNEQVKEAYETLALWQLQYINENGVPFNFINNRSYIEEIGESDESIQPSQKNENIKEEPEISKEDAKELEQAREELMKDMDKNDIEESGGVWDDSINLPYKNLVIIGVLVLLLIVIGIVIWKRKQLNIDNDKH